MAKITISGYYGFGNIGDELILFSMLNSLRKLDNSLEIVVLSADPEFTQKTYNVQAIRRINIFSFFKELKKTDLFISGGGGLLQDITSFGSSFYYLGLIFLAQLYGKKTFLYAQGIGPLKNWLIRLSTLFILKRVSGITLRDENSKIFLQQLGISNSQMEVTADPVFALDLKKGNLPEEKKELKRIAFILRKLKTEEEKIILGTIDLVRKRLDPEVFLLSFQEKEDLPVAEKIIRQVSVLRSNPTKDEADAGDKVELFRWENFAQLFDFFSTLDLIISMRLHGLILGLLQNKVVIGLSADPKISTLAETFSFPLLSVDDLKNKNLVDLVVQIWQERGKYYKIIEEKIPAFSHKAERTAELALAVLKNC